LVAVLFSRWVSSVTIADADTRLKFHLAPGRPRANAILAIEPVGARAAVNPEAGRVIATAMTSGLRPTRSSKQAADEGRQIHPGYVDGDDLPCSRAGTTNDRRAAPLDATLHADESWRHGGDRFESRGQRETTAVAAVHGLATRATLSG
jgi:hypothetical protein